MNRLISMEARLVLRDPAALVYVFAFPLLTAMLLGQVYGPGGPEFEGVSPAHFYTFAYVGVVAAAMALVTLPGHLSTYRATGVQRRFRHSRFGAMGLLGATLVVSFVTIALATVALIITGVFVSDLPAIQSSAGFVSNFVVGTWAIIGLGMLISEFCGSSRSAQGLGLAVFFPSFLLGGGGPPPNSLGSGLERFSELLPLTHMIRGIQESALPLEGAGWNHLAASFAFGTVFWTLTYLRAGRSDSGA